ncbi:hypothetical protein QQZ08_010983 [Neonectria magnoliae]|uniref:Uncharacterized protein n=1 Tax=Neonectria magnoliae TaxID=2732573 RepID=A0ABR1HD76_9HYPO
MDQATYRLAPPTSKENALRSLTNTTFERNFGWILAVFVYITVVLSTMQVALDMERFGDDARFQQFSSGMALLSAAFVLAAVAIILHVWSTLF